MPILVRMNATEWALETKANRLLGPHLGRHRGGLRSERQLSRTNHLLLPLDKLAILPSAPTQSFRDELRFLLSVSRMDRPSRLCARLWIDGYTQTEISRALGTSQQSISNRLQTALRNCYDMSPVSFRLFSRRSIYRPPRRGRSTWPERRCLRCGEMFPLRNGLGVFCSQQCRELSRRRRQDNTAANAVHRGR